MKQKKDILNVLVLGMGASVFGREKRAVSTFSHTPRLKPYFLISKWEDGSVSRLLKSNQMNFDYAPFGYLGRSKPIWSLITLVHLPLLYFKIIKTYFNRQTELLLLINIHPFINAFFPILLLKIFCHSKLIFYLGDNLKNSEFNHVVAWWINKLSCSLIAISLAVKRELIALGVREDKIQVIYNGLNVFQFRKAEPQNLKKEFGWMPEVRLIGYVGQITLKKGITDFIEAARIILQKNSNCRFLLIGKTPLRNNVPKEIWNLISDPNLKNYVVFAGWRDEVEGIYKALDVVVVPSRHEEPMGNVNIEAMASGVPVVATRVGGVPEIIEDSVTGFLVEKMDINQIAGRVLELVENPNLRQKMGEAGKQRVAERHDILKNALLIEEIILNA